MEVSFSRSFFFFFFFFFFAISFLVPPFGGVPAFLCFAAYDLSVCLSVSAFPCVNAVFASSLPGVCVLWRC
ncbi:hypothetical protein FN846DRAFT_951457, partial [Sphaerosporella brunnea]